MQSAEEKCRAPRKMGPGVVEVMRSRQTKNNLSELGVNWLGNGHLNASESDLMYKYHVVSLSCVPSSRRDGVDFLHRAKASPVQNMDCVCFTRIHP